MINPHCTPVFLSPGDGGMTGGLGLGEGNEGGPRFGNMNAGPKFGVKTQLKSDSLSPQDGTQFPVETVR